MAVAVVGNEGVVGVHAMYAGAIMPCEASVQVAGTARVMKAADLRREMREGGELAELLGRYSQARLMPAMQTGACSRSHSITQRAARWILAIHERTGQARFRLTQERLALTLGVRWPTVSVVARDFQRAGLIDYRHGPRLESMIHGNRSDCRQTRDHGEGATSGRYRRSEAPDRVIHAVYPAYS